MLKLIALTILGMVILVAFRACRAFLKNLAKAKRSGLPYIITPYFGVGYVFMIISPIINSLVTKLPISQNWGWVKLSDRGGQWKLLRYAEEKYGDTFIIVSPFICFLRSSNAELNLQIVTRRNDFPKPIKRYKVVDMFGKSILTTEGQEWKRHRKVVGPSFSEKSNKLVFEESLKQVCGMFGMWEEIKGNSKADLKVQNTTGEMAMLSLHVICAAGFGVPQLWPNEKEEKLEGKGVEGFSGHKLMGNHKIGLKSALMQLLDSIIWFALFSPKVLKTLPFKSAKASYSYFLECKAYFEELVEMKKKQMYIGENEKGTMDLLGPMIKSSSQSPLDTKSPESASLTKEEIIGNSFILLFAGHETSSNSINFSCILLAMHLQEQKRLQADVDSIVGKKSIEEWSYYTDMPRLYNSMVGAVLNEQMRLIPAIPNIPKVTIGDQIVRIDGQQHIISNNIKIHLNVVGTNRNPRYWPKVKSEITGKENNLDDFIPSRWLPSVTEEKHQKAEESNQEADGLDSTSFETSSATSLIKPPKGSFISFSEGPRSCPGRRFAQVEITAVLSAIFQKYTVELDVSNWASDEQVRKMSKEEKRIVYGKAVERANEKIMDCTQVITLQFKPRQSVPLRFLERGREMFGDI